MSCRASWFTISKKMQLVGVALCMRQTLVLKIDSFYTPAVAECILLSVSPSVTTFWNYLAKSLDDFDNFLHAAFLQDEKRYQISFWSQNYKWVLQGGLRGHNLEITIIFIYCSIFRNLEQFFSLLLQGDSNGLKPKYQKGIFTIERLKAVSYLQIYV